MKDFNKRIELDLVCCVNEKTKQLDVNDAKTLELAQILSRLNIEYRVLSLDEGSGVPSVALAGRYEDMTTYLIESYGATEAEAYDTLADGDSTLLQVMYTTNKNYTHKMELASCGTDVVLSTSGEYIFNQKDDETMEFLKDLRELDLDIQYRVIKAVGDSGGWPDIEYYGTKEALIEMYASFWDPDTADEAEQIIEEI